MKRIILSAMLVAMTAVAPAVASGWLGGETDIDPFTDKAGVIAFNETTDDIALFSVDPKPKQIVVRCENGDLDVFVQTSGFVTINANAKVEYRFDQDAPITERWSASTTGQAVFVPDGYKDFKDGLKSATKVAIKVTDYNGTTAHSLFDLSAGREFVKAAFDACA